MSGAELVVGIIAAFFIIGIVVGVIAVIALSAVRKGQGRRGEPRRGSGWHQGDGPDAGPGWEEPPGPDDQDDGYPRWPAGSAG